LDLKLSTTKLSVTDAKDVKVTATLTVRNTGSVTGSDVVQLYTAIPEHPLIDQSPSRALKGFAKVKDIAPSKNTTVTIALDKYAFSNWDAQKNAWTIRKGVHPVRIAASSLDVRLESEVTFEKDVFWSGL